MGDQQRQMEAVAAQRREFAQAFSQGGEHLAPMDRFRNPIVPGDKILYRPPFDLVFTVLDVVPVMDPRSAPGTVKMVLRAEFPVMGASRAQDMSMIVVARPSAVEKVDAAPGMPENPGDGRGPEPTGADPDGDPHPIGSAG